MSEAKIVYCDREGCPESYTKEPPRAGSINTFIHLSLAFDKYPREFDFCCLDCMKDFLDKLPNNS